ncbi:unnamed protein product [Urochloa humidicola]
MVVLKEAAPWFPSSMDAHYLGSLSESGVLPRITDSSRPEWIVPPASHREPNPPPGYVVSLAPLHERRFGSPAGRFIRALCHHYGVELHNFAPNAISQAAVFVAVCEGFLGVPVHWDLWIHLFRGELHTAFDGVKGVRRYVRAGGLMLQVREGRRNLYIPATMTSNNQDWDKGWFYLRNDGDYLPAYTGKILQEKSDRWSYGVSPPERQNRLAAFTDALHSLTDSSSDCCPGGAKHRNRGAAVLRRGEGGLDAVVPAGSSRRTAIVGGGEEAHRG